MLTSFLLCGSIGTKKSYQEFVGSLKVSLTLSVCCYENGTTVWCWLWRSQFGLFMCQKGGGALIITMRSKANITVRDEYRGTCFSLSGLDLCRSSGNTLYLVQAKGLTKPRFKNILHTVGARSCILYAELNLQLGVFKTVNGFTFAYVCVRVCVFVHVLQEEQGTECPLQRGGSVSQRRNKSEFLQWRLPITQHFGTVRAAIKASQTKPKYSLIYCFGN